ncbi:MFS transporter [uncultured Sphaerochaeta sp.]|uniref:MFS transporter n=1 Tax=uncultured Sphaerochaeta sp. TaxID=886478 RepID=UPI002A0A65D2|nr:MFS transporter [uncultured Sphaerochaeta sp.]
MEFAQEKTASIQFWVLNVSSFIAQLTIAMVNLVIVYHLKDYFGLTAEKIGIATSITTAMYLVFCIAGASICTHFRPRNLVEVSLAGMAVSVAFFASTSNLIVAYCSLAFYGAFMSLLWPQIEGWFSRGKEGAQLNHVTNAFNFSWSFGVGVSSYVAGILVEHSTTLPFYIAVVLFFIVFLLIYLSSVIVPGIRAVASEHTEIQQSQQKDNSTSLRYYSWIGLMLVYSGMSLILTIFPLYAQDVLKISESTTGLLLLIRGVTTCFGFLALGLTGFWQFKKSYIFLTQILFSILCLAAVHIRSIAGYAIFFFVFGLVFASGYDLSMFHGASGCLNRSQRMIIHEVLLTVGSIFGAVFGGFIYEQFSFQMVLQLFAIISGIVIILELGVSFLLDNMKSNKTA